MISDTNMNSAEAETNSDNNSNADSNNVQTDDSEKEKSVNFDKKSTSVSKKDQKTIASVESLKSAEKWFQLAEYSLTIDDKRCLESTTEWLTDTVMNVAQHLLSVQFPDIKGLQNVLLNQIQEFEAIQSGLPFVQIINDSDHWFVLSNVKVQNRDKEIKVYDSNSYFNQNYSMKTKSAVLKLMAEADNISVEIPFVSQQEDYNQYGLYAIAFAYILCIGEDPATVLLSNSAELLRTHLLKCFEDREITRFPTGAQTTIDSFII